MAAVTLLVVILPAVIPAVEAAGATPAAEAEAIRAAVTLVVITRGSPAAAVKLM
jgi:hypothetical protein